MTNPNDQFSTPQAAALYLRISDDKAGQALGVDRQEKEARAKAEGRGWLIAEVYIDNDTSASKANVRRPEYLRMMKALRTGDRDGLVCWDFDRTNRQLRDLADIIDLKIPVLSVTGNEIDLGTVAGRLVATILGGVARQQVEHQSENIVNQIKHKALSGRPNGHKRSFGWTDNTLRTPHPVEAPALREAIEAVLAGTAVRSITSKWNRTGLMTSTGGTWHYSTVKQTLTRWSNVAVPLYRGQPLPNVKGDWTPLVDRESFNAVRAMLTSRSPSDRAPRTYLLTNVMTCGKCQGRMRGGSGRYNCVNEFRGLCSLTIQPAIADAMIREYVVDRLVWLAGQPIDKTSVIGRRAYVEQALLEVQVEKDQIAESGLDLSSRIVLLREVEGREKLLKAESVAMSASSALSSVIANLPLSVVADNFKKHLGANGMEPLVPIDDTGEGPQTIDLEEFAASRELIRSSFEALDLSQQRMIIKAYGNYTVLPFTKRGADRIVIERLYPDLRVLAVAN